MSDAVKLDSSGLQSRDEAFKCWMMLCPGHFASSDHGKFSLILHPCADPHATISLISPDEQPTFLYVCVPLVKQQFLSNAERLEAMENSPLTVVRISSYYEICWD